MLRMIMLLMATVGVALLGAPPAALAFERPFPPDALRGRMTPGYFPDVGIDGKARRLSPSARIFNQDNTIDMPGSLRGSDIVVNYTVDATGHIDRIWILTRDEAARKLPTAAEAAAAGNSGSR
ncbi:hypothetical protein SAMN05428959_105387 [Duganella sp. CF517]|uniref:hypothetical protein n=1 Tax=Duganella sp. CF517 TaxID=1881038 RepID=UPI0008B3D7CD|nr:hypothetical protein [Duganella sp. CF517]SEO21332.1 hypothetical protein SAMN05428959_105387 [Duganella sp. CF517]